MRLRFGPAVITLLSLPLPILAQAAADSMSITAVRTPEPITIDGLLQESVWRRPGFTAFTQRLPNEGTRPTEKTEVWLAYDDQALYVGARMEDAAPDSIMRMMARRDADIAADWFQFDIDPYHDRMTGFYFALSAGGTLQDGTLYNDDGSESSWDGVWEGKAHVDAGGWTAEMRIPYSQLRFHPADQYVWAVNFSRKIGRRNESDYVVYTPLKGTGFVSRFIDVKGIERISPLRDIEIMPYMTARAEYSPHAAADPFNDGSSYRPGFGADLKTALGPDMTLNATINPDFGQVEVDPAVVNLGDIETYYDEKRPFFVEGSNIFRFGQGGTNENWSFNWNSPTFFYTRRIGRAPEGSLPSYDYADIPPGTHILGAAKLTGKVMDSWNMGMIQAVTNREFARIQTGGTKERVEIEPLTYYGVGRLQRDFDDGRRGIGVITTYTGRFFEDQRLRDDVNSQALAAGLDGWEFLDPDKTYVLTGWGAFSSVHGDRARITALQSSSRHYLQRPDAKRFRLDSSATSLTGYAGRLFLNKQKGSVRLNASLGVVDPRFDVDDAGFLWRTGIINYHIATGYRWTDRTPSYNNLGFWIADFGTYDFDGNKVWQGVGLDLAGELPNYFDFSLGLFYNPATIDTRSTRGGPAMVQRLGREIDLSMSTDSRQITVFSFNGFRYQGGGGDQFQAELDVDFKPLPNIELTVGPSIGRALSEAQWVGSYADPTAPYGSRYLFADLDQRTIAANIRLNWTFTPQLSLQLFVQPLISAADYSGFTALAQARTYTFLRYGEGKSTIAPGNASPGPSSFTVDADGAGPAPGYTFTDPSFNLRSLRGNAVLRWEYRPGSTLYLVWTQTRSDTEPEGELQFRHSLSRLVEARPDNIFMLKFTYWWNW